MQKTKTRTPEFGARSRPVLKQNRGEPGRRLQLGRSVTTELSDHAAKPRRSPPAATMSLIDKVMQLAEYGGEDEHAWLLLEPEA